MRQLKRAIVKHFGSTKSFALWLVAVIVTIYVIDSYILTRDRLESLVQGPKNEVKRMDQDTGDSQKPDSNKPQPNKSPEKNPPPADKEKEKSAQSEKKKEEPAEKPEAGKCGLKEACPAGKYAYMVKTGEGREGTPTICFNGKYAMSPDLNNGNRGINMAVINDANGELEEVRYFDTYSDDSALLRFLKLGVVEKKIILIATMDEASNSLKGDVKKLLNQFGSSAIDKLRFRDGLVMVGQRGLSHGSAIEKFSPRDRHEFAPKVEVSGCLSSPIGKLNEVVIAGGENKDAAKPDAKAADGGGVKAGEELANCGVKDGCGPDSFSAHLFTGVGNSQGPKICVGGKYVLATGLNDGGRGFNIVIVDPKNKEVIRVGHFDTYSEDSSNLEIFLEMMNEGEIVLAVTSDDASKNLHDHGRKLFEERGATMLEKLDFRDVWAFVGLKGIDGHSTIEDLEQRFEGASWPNAIDMRVCVPVKMKGTKIKPDPMANKNEKRRKFCAKYDGYGDFCESGHIDEALTAAPLADKTLENHNIFKVPVIVIPGLNHNAVRMQLETLLLNPGIKPEMVTVMFDEKFNEPAALAELFNFQTAKLSSSTKYVFQTEKALEKVWELYPEAKNVIVLEEEVIVGPDFLFFLAQCLDTVEKDDSLLGVSGWNENGYEGLSGLTDLAYRTETFPGLGFLLKKSFYDLNMKGKMADCCRKRSWDGWFGGHVAGKEMIIPDTSRVYRRPYEGLSEQGDMLTELFNRPRVTNLESQPQLSNVDKLSKADYETSIVELLKSSTALDSTNVADCLEGRGLGFYVPEATGKLYSVYFEQRNADDLSTLALLCRCFKLFYVKNYPPRGLHNNSIRFGYKGNSIFLVGSSSPYYAQKPSSYKPVKKS